VITWIKADVADNSGRARAKHRTKNQYDGLSDAHAVMTRPTSNVRRSTVVRPHRSAKEARGNAPSEASRSTASPMPRTEPERPTTLWSDWLDVLMAKVVRDVVE